MSNDRKKKKKKKSMNNFAHRSTMAGMGPIPILSTTVLSDCTNNVYKLAHQSIGWIEEMHFPCFFYRSLLDLR